MQTFNDVWQKALSIIKSHITNTSFDSWIKMLRPMKFENDIAYFYAQSLFQKGLIENKFKTEIESALTEVMGFPITMKVLTEQDVGPSMRKRMNDFSEEFEKGIDENAQFFINSNNDLTFDTFVVGNENKFAHAAALAVANNPAGAYNPFFLYGRSGLGKTHLLCAIANEIKKNDPKATVIYIKGEEFANELIDAIKNGEQTKFRNKYRFADAFLVDDVQFIGGKVSTQEEFFHTFNSLYEAKKQIVLTSDRPPKEMLTLEERLKTRFECGLIADIQPPEYETRMAIIRQKAEALQLNLSNNIVDYIATKLKSNVRELEGVIKKIKAYNILWGEQPTMLIAQNAIKSVINENMPQSVTPEMIIEHVSRYYNIPLNEIQSTKRSSDILFARQVAMYLTRELTNLSLPAIGEHFNGKNHSTVLHSIRKMEQMVERDPKLKQTMSELSENIKKAF